MNPFDTNANASSALLGGAAADNAFGNPSIRPQAGLRTARSVYEQTKAYYDQQETQKPQQPVEPMLGYDKDTDTLYSGGKAFKADNLSVLADYDRAGFFNIDNRGKVPQGMPLVPASTIRAWMQQEGQQRGFMSAAGEVANQVVQGVPDIINMGVQAAAMNAPAGSWLEKSLGDAAKSYELGREGVTPDTYGRGEVASALVNAGRALAPSVAAGAASLAAPIVGTGAAGYIMGSSQAWDTYQRGLDAGLSPEAAKSAALKTGTIEGVGEAAADAAAARILPGAGKYMAGLLRGAAPKGYGKKVAIDLLANAGVQAGTEVGQQYMQSVVERDAGIRPDADPMAEGIEAGKVGLGLAALMAPLGLGSAYANRPRKPMEAPELPVPVDTTPAPGALVPFNGIPTDIEDVTPKQNYGFGVGTPPLLPAPAGPVQYPEGTIYVSPQGTAVAPGQDPTNIQEDLFGATAQTPDYSADAPIQEEPAPRTDTVTVDPFGEVTTMVAEDFSLQNIRKATGSKSVAAATMARKLHAALGNPEKTQAVLEEIDQSRLGANAIRGLLDIAERYAEWKSLADQEIDTALAPQLTAQPVQEPAQQDILTPPVTMSEPVDTTDVDNRVAGEQQLATQRERRSILDRVLADPAPGNKLRRFSAVLRKLGYRDIAPTPEEMKAAARHQEITDVLNAPEEAPVSIAVPPNEMPADLVRERRPKGPATTPKMQRPVMPAPEPVVEPAAFAPPEPEPTPEPKPVKRPTLRVKRLKVSTPTEAADLTANVPDDLTPLQTRLLDRITRAYDADQIDTTQEMELRAMVRAGDTAEAVAELHRAAVENVGITRARFRTKEPVSGSLPHDLLAKVIARVEKALGRKINLIVLDSVTQLLPNEKPGVRSGMLYKGDVYLFRDGIGSMMEAQKAILHELLHRGLRNVLPDADYIKVMHKLYNQSAEVRAKADEWLYTADAKKMEALKGEDYTKAVAADEALAQLAEASDINVSILRKVMNWVADVAASFGLTDYATRIRAMGRSEMQKFLYDHVLVGADKKGDAPTAVEPMFRTSDAAREYAADFGTKVSDAWKFSIKGAAKRGLLSSSFLRDLGARFEKKFSRVKEYVDTSSLMSEFTGTLQRDATEVADAIAPLDKAERTALFDLMGDATVNGLSLEGDNDSITDAQKAKLEELKDQFDALPEQSKVAYRTARDALKKNWKLRASLLSDTANQIYEPLIAAAKEANNVPQVRALERERNAYIADTNARLAEIKGDYFPLVRFGDWSVVRKSEQFKNLQAAANKAHESLQLLLDRLDRKTLEQRKIINKANKNLEPGERISELSPEDKALVDAARTKYEELAEKLEDLKSYDAHYYVAQFESEAAAQGHKREVGGEVSYRAEYHKELNPISRTMLNRLEEAMSAQLGNTGNATAVRDAKRAMYQIYLSSLPESSALKRQSRRKNVAGWNRDMQRNIISTMFRDSFFLSRLKYSDALDGALHSVRQEADASASRGEPGGTDLQRAAAELERRHAASMKFVDTPVQDALSAWAYVSFLGISPGFLVANLMQPWLVSAPMMVARHGLKAMKELNGAYSSANKLILDATKHQRGDVDLSKAKIGPNGTLRNESERGLLAYLLSNQLLNVTLAHDLSSIASGAGVSSRWSRAIAKPSHYVEMANRIATALAAYRLELAKTGDTQAAQRYAAKVVSDTHFDYSAENAPYWMKPGVMAGGKLLFQFKKYQVGMISLYAKNMYNMSDPATRKEAMGTVAGLLATHLAVAGSLGLPAAGALTFIFQIVSDAFGDEPDNVEAEYRNWLARTFGKEAGLVLAKGLPTLIGLDFSQKVGAGNLLSPLPNLRETSDARTLYQEMMMGAAGPVFGGLVPKYFQAVQDLSRGDYQRAAIGVLPKFMADPLRAGTFLTDGVKTRSGLTMEEDVGAWRAFITSTGVPAAAISEMYDANGAIKDVERNMDEMSTRFKKEWVAETPQGRAELQASLAEINAVRKKYGGKPIFVGDLFRFKATQDRANLAYKKYGSNIRGSAELAATGDFARE